MFAGAYCFKFVNSLKLGVFCDIFGFRGQLASLQLVCLVVILFIIFIVV